jgi:hypothetical protein
MMETGRKEHSDKPIRAGADTTCPNARPTSTVPGFGTREKIDTHRAEPAAPTSRIEQ